MIRFNKVAITAMSGRAVQALGWVFAIPLITSHLSAIEQGYYYTFLSLSALQVFVELGMSGVVVQSIAHEVAHLSLIGTKGTSIEWSGSAQHRSRLVSVIRFAKIWFGLAGIVAIFALAAGGWWFLSAADQRYSVSVAWRGPWLLMSLSVGCSVVAAGALSMLEGFGNIGVATFIRLTASIAGLCGLVLSLLLSAGLWSVPISMCLVVVVIVIGSWRWLICPLQATARSAPDVNYSWRAEIWPFQWRIALSWMSGWVIFQSMTPTLMQISGPEAAGRFGLALQIANGVQSMALVWTQIRLPTWGMLISRGEWASLDQDFTRWTKASIMSAIAGSAMVIVGLHGIAYADLEIQQRMPAIEMIIPLLSVAILNQWVFSVAGYLRAHRREPFLVVSIASAFFMLVSFQFLDGRNRLALPWTYAAMSFFTGGLVGTIIWKSCKVRWHSNANQEN